MFAAHLYIEHIKDSGPKMPRLDLFLMGKEKLPVPALAEASMESTWMLAVCDQRDREAFAHLYNHFAPLLKGKPPRWETLGEGISQSILSTDRKGSVAAIVRSPSQCIKENAAIGSIDAK